MPRVQKHRVMTDVHPGDSKPVASTSALWGLRLNAWGLGRLGFGEEADKACLLQQGMGLKPYPEEELSNPS